MTKNDADCEKKTTNNLQTETTDKLGVRMN